MKYDKLIKETINKNKLIQINNNIVLTSYQIEILDKYKIPYYECNSVNEIIFYIEEILNQDSIDLEDLENVSTSLAENDYYQNYHK